MHIVMTGAHGVGKTTLLKALKDELPNYDVQVESLTRKAVGDSSKANFGTTGESQMAIANLYKEFFDKSPDNFIASRHIVDNLAYSLYLQKVNKNIPESVIVATKIILKEILKNKLFDLVFFIPVEFPQVESGEFREGQIENPDYQKDINTIIKYLLWEYGIKHIILTGSVEQRIDKILKEIKKREED